MSRSFLPQLVNEASQTFRPSGRFAYHYARGKLGHDTIFHEMLRRGLLPGGGPAGGHYLDLGCGQGSLFAWLLAARRLHEQGQWPADWAPPPQPRRLRGVELMQRDVDRAARAFGPQHPVVRVEQGDMNTVDFGQPDAILILDALHYFSFDEQRAVLARIRQALPPGGVFLTRVGDAGAGLTYRICNGVDRLVTYTRGHRLPRLYCRTLADWVGELQRLGFEVETEPMSGRKPFANVMLVCRVPHGDRPGNAPAFETMRDSVPSTPT
ncbi:trans-aconitate 2-methyltransferase [Hydrogenophaga sp.]|jgi:SAM-dependent methyltransferase|uniref:class I SAM-dependent methyltransferase n=1 Tax=Hydrogenophaga sp. TaxID=1904254 RepID=UPI0027313F78|nr:class I SAM-dependent methyltransferase [Hydrogenophaga sp.]MDP1685759.1 class I SAM-dependent methyltransferase [Hydrogenophaga sp.]